MIDYLNGFIIREKDGNLFPNSYSSVLRLPGYSYDVRNFDREFAYEIVLPEGVAQETGIEEEKKLEEEQNEYKEETAVLCNFWII